MEDLSRLSKLGLGALGAGTVGTGTVLAFKKAFEYTVGMSLSDAEKVLKQREELVALVESMAPKSAQV